MIDIRLPIGWIFMIIGTLLVLLGFMNPIMTQCGVLSINLNRDWGALMLGFGIFMTALSYFVKAE